MTIYQLRIFEGEYDDHPREFFYSTFEGAQRGAEEWLTEHGCTTPSDFQQQWERMKYSERRWNESCDDFTLSICPAELLH